MNINTNINNGHGYTNNRIHKRLFACRIHKSNENAKTKQKKIILENSPMEDKLGPDNWANIFDHIKNIKDLENTAKVNPILKPLTDRAVLIQCRKFKELFLKFIIENLPNRYEQIKNDLSNSNIHSKDFSHPDYQKLVGFSDLSNLDNNLDLINLGEDPYTKPSFAFNFELKVSILLSPISLNDLKKIENQYILKFGQNNWENSFSKNIFNTAKFFKCFEMPDEEKKIIYREIVERLVKRKDYIPIFNTIIRDLTSDIFKSWGVLVFCQTLVKQNLIDVLNELIDEKGIISSSGFTFEQKASTSYLLCNYFANEGMFHQFMESDKLSSWYEPFSPEYFKNLNLNQVNQILNMGDEGVNFTLNLLDGKKKSLDILLKKISDPNEIKIINERLKKVEENIKILEKLLDP